jgi:hypothetical protein
LPGALFDVADLDDLPVCYRNIRMPPRRASAVDDQAVLDEKIVSHDVSCVRKYDRLEMRQQRNSH